MAISRYFVWFLTIVSHVWVCGPKTGGEPGTAKNTKADINQLSFLCGTWIREQGKDELEEVWLAPRGDCMTGTFRWIKDGKVWMYELMSICEDKDGLVFRIRHFDRSLTAKEPEPLVYELKSVDKDKVVFEHSYADHMDKFVFSRPDANTYSVRLEETDGSKRKPLEFSFNRAD